MSFSDLLDNNVRFAKDFAFGGLTGQAHCGVALVTCMDSRIMPLEMVGLEPGDAKILRTPGARVTPETLNGLVLARHLLSVDRVLIIQHTRCAMAATSDAELAARVLDASGVNVSHRDFGANPDQIAALAEDVDLVTAEPAMLGTQIGGFMYDVDTGLLTQVR